MSYTPTTWTTGDTITASAMNKIENGIASAGGGVSGLVVYDNGSLDKNFNELKEIMEAGAVPYFEYEYEDAQEHTYFLYYLQFLTINEGDYMAFFTVYNGEENVILGFLASSATGTLTVD